jgi:hypothetical protein
VPVHVLVSAANKADKLSSTAILYRLAGEGWRYYFGRALSFLSGSLSISFAPGLRSQTRSQTE